MLVNWGSTKFPLVQLYSYNQHSFDYFILNLLEESFQVPVSSTFGLSMPLPMSLVLYSLKERLCFILIIFKYRYPR